MFKILKKIFGIFTSEVDTFYKIVAAIGLVVRYIAFGFLCKSLIEELGNAVGIIVSICTFIINYLLEKPLYKFTYTEVGIFYESGTNYALGSLLYTLFYLINCAIISIIIWFYKSSIYYLCLLTYIVLVLIVRGIVYLIRDK